MRTLRLLRNISALFIVGTALLATRPGVQLLHAKKGSGSGTVCVEILPGTYGYNCTFNTDGTCSTSTCQAGQTCNDMVCTQACGTGNKPGWTCGYDATGQCRESRCKNSSWECSNSGCE